MQCFESRKPRWAPRSPRPLDHFPLRRYAFCMPLPVSIAVRYTDEEAGFVSVRPVLRMSLRPEQLLELILGVTGKTPERVQQILLAGTVAAGGYRYWWEGVETGEPELAAALEAFPDADPSRAFDPARCMVVVAESAGAIMLSGAEFTAAEAGRRRRFRRRAFWAVLIDAAAPPHGTPVYRSYSYARRGDLYSLELAPGTAVELASAARRLGVPTVRAHAGALERAARLVYVCRR